MEKKAEVDAKDDAYEHMAHGESHCFHTFCTKKGGEIVLLSSPYSL